MKVTGLGRLRYPAAGSERRFYTKGMSDNGYYVNFIKARLIAAHEIPPKASLSMALLRGFASMTQFPILALNLSLPGQAPAQTVPKREHFQNAEITYGWVQDSRGDRLRTFVCTRWSACD